METQQTVGITTNDLKDIIAVAIQEGRKPLPPTEKELAQAELDKRMREQSSRLENEKREKVRAQQKNCTHRHPAKEHNASYGVLMNVDGIQYVFCQFCRAKVREGTAPEGYKGSFIFDTALFNKLVQEI